MSVHVEDLTNIMCTNLQITFREDFFNEMTLVDSRVISRSRRDVESVENLVNIINFTQSYISVPEKYCTCSLFFYGSRRNEESCCRGPHKHHS